MLSAPVFATIVALVAAGVQASAQPRPTMADYNKGKEATAAAAKAEAANDSKMAAVNKVVEMLQDLQAKVKAEGEAEAATYTEVCRMCKTARRKKSKAIKEGQDQKTALTAEIKRLNTVKNVLDKGIKKNVAGIKADEKSIKNLKDTHAQDTATYDKNKADVMSGVNSLADAVKVLKSGKSASLLQVQSASKTVEDALLLADALGLGGAASQKTASLLQQDSQGAPSVEMENFKFHSGDIIATVEKLQADFRKANNDLDAAQVKRVANHNVKMQHFTDAEKAKTLEMEDEQQVDRSQTIEDIGTATQDLKATKDTLSDDQGFLDAMNTMCKMKETVYNQRSTTRANELTALAQALAITKNTVAKKTGAATLRLSQTAVSVGLADAVASSDSAMEAIEAEVESEDSAVGFLQKKAVRNHQPKSKARELVLALFKGKGHELHSAALTELSAKIAADPFAKIKKLIQEQIENLLAEAGAEADRKGWCDKAFSDAEQKRDYAERDMNNLNARMGKAAAFIDQMQEEISKLEAEVKDIKEEVQEATTDRNNEKKENAQTVKDAKAGKAAVDSAIEILNKFYGTAANKAKKIAAPEEDLDKFKRVQDNEQARDSIATDCKKDCSGMTKDDTAKCEAAEATCIKDAEAKVAKASHAEASKAKVAEFAASEGQDAQQDEAYAGSSAAAGGIVGMMEVIQSDFVRTISETEREEKEAADEHMQFITQTSSSLAQKKIALAQKTKLMNEADDNHETDEDELGTRSNVLSTAVKELIELKAQCIDTGMSYKDRVAKREDEIASLNKGMCLLEKSDDAEAKSEC